MYYLILHTQKKTSLHLHPAAHTPWPPHPLKTDPSDTLEHRTGPGRPKVKLLFTLLEMGPAVIQTDQQHLKTSLEE